MTEHLLLRHRDIAALNRLEVYLQHGGFETFRRVVTTLAPQQVIDGNRARLDAHLAGEKLIVARQHADRAIVLARAFDREAAVVMPAREVR